MAEILQAYKEKRGIFVEFMVSGIQISSLVKNYSGKTAQQIAEEAFSYIYDAVMTECERTGIEFDNTLPAVEPHVVSLSITGLYPTNFTEGVDTVLRFPIQVSAETNFGEIFQITDFDISTNQGVISPNTIELVPSENTELIVTVGYGGITKTSSCNISFTSSIEYGRIQEEQEEQRQQALSLQLEETKIQKIRELDTECRNDILKGFTCHIKEEDRFFGFDLDDQLNLAGKLTIINASSDITSVFWKCKGIDGIVDSYTVEEFRTICSYADEQKTEKMMKFWNKKNEILACTAIEEVSAIIWQ